MIGERLAILLEDRGWSQAELARRVGITPQSIGKLARGESQGSKHLHRIAALLETSPDYLMGDTDNPHPGHAPDKKVPFKLDPAEVADRTLEIPVIDLAYGMGGTYLDDVDANVRSEPFPLSFIRRYTKAKAEDLVIADGLGDSMAPTIGSNDQMLIDRSVDTLRVADQIWAFSFGGVGMVKRLRPRPDGSIAILSDNSAVPEDRAVDEELFLIGRVVAIVRKV
ncbi:XRE family transcriptional regulator [Qipengyuania citrea]|uniref:XRE family transcriptional regulator n=1 Tax=Qipengyuania citrea TaxID=225971 RepID=UPI00209CE203|nr:S24 family peptidase [Qipengyuania citrea]MCP2016859.1 phage repressor protein C with HTH and peptisase S24 domain [Qipengyuania citrea]